MNPSPNVSPAKANPDSQIRTALRGMEARSPETERRRAAVIRRGERDPISPTVRHLVYRRDQWTCQRCRRTPFAKDGSGYESGALHLDHIVPWSAGGSDRTDNLRTLCAPCLAGHEPKHQRWIEAADPDSHLAVWCAKHGYEGWAVRGWRIL